jgi:hypothetical protein
MGSLVTCKDCGSKISRKAKSCPSCGRSMVAKQYGCGTLIALGMTAFVLFVVFSPKGQNRNGQNVIAIKTGDFATVAGQSVAWVALSEDAWTPMIDAQNKGDKSDLVRLSESHAIEPIKSGSRVQVIGSSVTSRKIEVLDGPSEGVSGWIQTELLLPSK